MNHGIMIKEEFSFLFFVFVLFFKKINLYLLLLIIYWFLALDLVVNVLL